MANTVFFVSKRLQRVAAALLCLMLAQVVFAAVAPISGPAPVGVRVAITR